MSGDNEGNVQVCSSGSWSPVCRHSQRQLRHAAARLICQELGFSNEGDVSDDLKVMSCCVFNITIVSICMILKNHACYNILISLSFRLQDQNFSSNNTNVALLRW